MILVDIIAKKNKVKRQRMPKIETSMDLDVKKLIIMSVIVLVCLGLFYGLTLLILKDDTKLSENNLLLEKYAVVGLRLYSIGFIFAGLNVIGSGIFSATNFPKWAFATSIARGFLLIILSAVVMSILFGMTGVWLAFAVAELLTLIITSIGLTKITKF